MSGMDSCKRLSVSFSMENILKHISKDTHLFVLYSLVKEKELSEGTIGILVLHPHGRSGIGGLTMNEIII